MAKILRNVYPDQRVIHREVAKGDIVFIRWSMTGTPKQDVLGTTPSNKQETVTGFDEFCISYGKFVEMWQCFSCGSWR